MTDAELISRAIVEGDRDAYGALVKKYQAPLRALFRKLTAGDMVLADDLAQETFLRAFKGLRGFRGGSQVLTWLYAIAKNVFFEHVRNQNPAIVSLEENETGREMTVDSRLDALKLLRRLQPDERLVLSLSYAEELSHSEIAEIMTIPVGTVKTLIARSKDKLRLFLADGKRREV